MDGGIIGWLLTTGAAVGAVGVICGGCAKAYRAVRHAWAHAVAEQVDPKIAALRADVETRFDQVDGRLADLDAAIGRPNGHGDIARMLERLLHRFEQDDEHDRLAREGRIERRRTDG